MYSCWMVDDGERWWMRIWTQNIASTIFSFISHSSQFQQDVIQQKRNTHMLRHVQTPCRQAAHIWPFIIICILVIHSMIIIDLTEFSKLKSLRGDSNFTIKTQNSLADLSKTKGTTATLTLFWIQKMCIIISSKTFRHMVSGLRRPNFVLAMTAC